MIFPIIIATVVLIIDQLSKIWAASLVNEIVVIDGVFSFTYVENKGMAWGLMSEHQLPLYIVSGILVLALIVFAIFQYKKMPTMIKISFMLILSGAIGNMIDRLFLGYVRDMLYFSLIDFPVFNVADSALCIGVGLLIIACLFTKKGRDYIAGDDEKPSKDDNTTENDIEVTDKPDEENSVDEISSDKNNGEVNE